MANFTSNFKSKVPGLPTTCTLKTSALPIPGLPTMSAWRTSSTPIPGLPTTRSQRTSCRRSAKVKSLLQRWQRRQQTASATISSSTSRASSGSGPADEEGHQHPEHRVGAAPPMRMIINIPNIEWERPQR